MDLLERLQELRGNKSQEQFAREVGLDQSTISRLFSGEMHPGLRTFRKLCQRFPELQPYATAFVLRKDSHP